MKMYVSCEINPLQRKLQIKKPIRNLKSLAIKSQLERNLPLENVEIVPLKNFPERTFYIVSVH